MGNVLSVYSILYLYTLHMYSTWEKQLCSVDFQEDLSVILEWKDLFWTYHKVGH